MLSLCLPSVCKNVERRDFTPTLTLLLKGEGTLEMASKTSIPPVSAVAPTWDMTPRPAGD